LRIKLKSNAVWKKKEKKYKYTDTFYLIFYIFWNSVHYWWINQYIGAFKYSYQGNTCFDVNKYMI